jgi:hypothetical protein
MVRFILLGRRSLSPVRFLVAILGIGMLTSCAGVDDPTLPEPKATLTAAPETTTPQPTAAAQSNACPAEGCMATIDNVEDAGDEIKVSFSSNYAPEISGNHYHVYWDRFDAKQVSEDAETKHGVTQGEWEPTADNPFTTTGAAAAGQRGESTTICVTPGDKNHNVIDPAVVNCRDAASLL